MPFQADIQSALFYIPNLLLTLFVSDGRLPYYALEVMVSAHYWLAGVTMYYLAKELGLESVYALFSGLVFALSGFMIVHAIHPGFVQQVAWFPLIVLLFHRAIRLHSLEYAILAGLVLGHAILAGAPQISLFLALFIVLFFLFLFVTGVRETGFRANRPTLWMTAAMAIAAAGIAAIQLLPTFELIPLSQRAAMSFADAQHGRLAWVQLLTAVIPKFLGAETAQEATFWGPGDYGTFWDTCFYLGIPGLLAVAMSVSLVRTNRYVAFLFGTVVLSLLLAVGNRFILHRVFFEIVPGFDNFRAIGRIVVLVTFCGALLAGFGVRAFVDLAARRPQRLQRAALGALAAIALVCALVWLGVFLPDPSHPAIRGMHQYASSKAGWALGLAIATCGVAALLARSIIPPIVAFGAVFVIQHIDVSAFGYNQNNGISSADGYYREARARIQPLLADTEREFFRIVARSGQQLMLDRNQGMVDRLFLVEGYTPLALQRRVPPAKDLDRSFDLLNAKYRIVVDTQARTMAFGKFSTYLPRVFVVHDVRVIPDSAAIDTFMRSDAFDPRRTVVVEEAPPFAPSFDTGRTTATAKIDQYRLNAIEIDVATPRPGMLVLSEIHYPGWKAYLDGTPAPVYRANWNLRAVPLPAGSHRVRMRFEAPPFRRGAIITAVTLAIAAVVLIRSALRRRSSPA